MFFGLSFGKHIAITAFVILFLVMIFKGFKFKEYIKKKGKPNQKLWLLEDIIFRNASATAIVQLSFVINIYNTIGCFWNFKYATSVFAVVFTITSIYSYVSVVVLPENAEKLLKKTYPEYSLV